MEDIKNLGIELDNFEEKIEKRIFEIDLLDQIMHLFGPFDEYAKMIESETETRLAMHDKSVVIIGEPEKVNIAFDLLSGLSTLIERGEKIDKAKVRYAISLAKEGNARLISDLGNDIVAFTYKGKQIKTKTLGQKAYLHAMRKDDVVFAIGPAGTGKTYLAVAVAVRALKNKQVARIILTRPAVEAGEKLGFLPGDLQNKVDPYLRPLYDALQEFLGMDNFKLMLEKGVIEVAPLAYMRGRTLSNAYIILDEAQNASVEQMKMFLTRFGEGSKVVVTGDVTQIDLPDNKASGLVHSARILKNVEGLTICQLTYKDVVRHEMVQRIVQAYEKADKDREKLVELRKDTDNIHKN